MPKYTFQLKLGLFHRGIKWPQLCLLHVRFSFLSSLMIPGLDSQIDSLLKNLKLRSLGVKLFKIHMVFLILRKMRKI